MVVTCLHRLSSVCVCCFTCLHEPSWWLVVWTTCLHEPSAMSVPPLGGHVSKFYKCSSYLFTAMPACKTTFRTFFKRIYKYMRHLFTAVVQWMHALRIQVCVLLVYRGGRLGHTSSLHCRRRYSNSVVGLRIQVAVCLCMPSLGKSMFRHNCFALLMHVLLGRRLSDYMIQKINTHLEQKTLEEGNGGAGSSG